MLLLAPIRDRRRDFEARPRIVTEALRKGSEAEREVAAKTMEAVRGALRLDHVHPAGT